MFHTFLKECKITVRSITYLILCIALVAIYFFQYREDVRYDLEQADKGIQFEESKWGWTYGNSLVKPVPGMESYGRAKAEVPEQVMRNVAYRLFRDISNDRFATNFLGVIPIQKDLKDEDKQRVVQILEKITSQPLFQIDATFYEMDMQKVLETQDMTEKEAEEYLRTYYKKLKDEFRPNHPPILLHEYQNYMPVSNDLSYNEFKILLNEIKSIIGGRTLAYEDLSVYGSVPVTYEEALTDYDNFINKDKVSRAYARLFCNYLGVAAGIVPAFIAAAIAMSDVRRKKQERLDRFTGGVDTTHLFPRFLAITAMSFLPIIILALTATGDMAFVTSPLGLKIDFSAFLKYSLAWLMPSVLIASATGLSFVIVFNKPVGIVIQGILWFWSISPWRENGPVSIKYGAEMVLRHNIAGEYETYISSLGEIILNRTAYVIAAFCLVAAAWYIERKGILRKI